MRLESLRIRFNALSDSVGSRQIVDGTAAEILIESIQKGARHMEVPIVVKKRRSGKSKMPPSKLTFGWKVFRVIIGTWWGGR